jgi:tetratricopeptide (TPR) repeat protein
VNGSVQRSGSDVRVTYSLLSAGAEVIASGTATRPVTELFALEDAVADDLIAELGRRLPARRRNAAAPLGPQDQQKFVEAVGLLQRMKDEQSIDRAIGMLESVLRNSRDSAPVNAQLARALLFKATLARRPALIEQAVVYATRASTLDPNDPEGHVTLGMLQNASGRSADAIRSFERALTQHPDRPDAMVGIAEAYEAMGRVSDAEAMYRKAISLRPDAAGALMSFGGFCYGRGRYEEAATQFRRATNLLPNFSQAWANLGLTLQALGRYDDALAASKKSIEIRPTAHGWSNLGTLQYTLGRYDEARHSYEQATQLAPSDPVMWMNLGDARRASKLPDANDAYARSIAASREALALNPNDARMHARVAMCLAKSGNAADAQTEIRRALEIDPTNPQILYNAAVISVLRGNNDGAISWLERAIANGYPAAEASQDPELAALKELPSFKSAVKSRS